MLSRSPGRLETALAGDPAHPSVAAEAALARSLGAVRVEVEPDPVFVAALRSRLRAEVGSREPARVEARPRHLLVGRRLRAAGAVLVLATISALVVVVAARAALPGQPLYAVREATEHAGVRVAGTDQARGTALLNQATRHVADAHTLVADAARSADIGTALNRSAQSTHDGAALMFADFAATKDPTALLALQAFTERLYPQVDALGSLVPPELRTPVLTLSTTLIDLRLDVLTALATCETCGSARDDARASLHPGVAPASAPASTAAGSTTGTASAAAGSAGSPGSAASGTTVTTTGTASSPSSSDRPTGTGTAGATPSVVAPSSTRADPTPGTSGPTTTLTPSSTVGHPTSCPPLGCG